MKNAVHLSRSDRAIRPKLMVLAAGVGLLLGAFTAEIRAENLIINGGFETGSFKGWRVIPAEIGSDFGVGSLTQIDQVEQGANNFGSPLDSPPFGVPASSGKYAAYYGAVFDRFDAIEQRIHTFSGPLGKYRISFRLKSDGPPSFNPANPSRFQALWNGHVIYETVNTVAGEYQQFVFKESADGSHSTLTFQGLQVPGWYFLDEVSVELVGKFADVPNLTPNQRAVAGALDRAANDPRAGALFGFLGYQDVNNLPRQFDRIAPEELTSMFAMSTAYAQVQSLNLQRRTDDIRNRTNGFSAANLAINGNGPSYSGGFGITTGVAGPNGNSGKESKEMKVVAPRDTRWGTFISGTGEWVHVGSTENARDYDLTSGGFTLGVDYKVCPNFAIGLAAGYTGTTADLTDRGRIFSNGGKLGLYATTFAGGWYADVAASGGYNTYDTRRAGLQGDARGYTKGGEIDALFGTGYDFKAGGLTFGPTATFNYTYVGTGAFTEHGSLVPLNIHSGEAESLRTAFGVKMSYDWKLGRVVIRPELRAAWQHEFGDTAYALDSSFANGANSTFGVNGPKLGRDSALLGAGFAIQCTERCSTYFYYDGELGRTNYHSSSVTGGLRVTF